MIVFGQPSSECSNRTFMELKPGDIGGALIGQACSNRTFMELKRGRLGGISETSMF